MNRHLCAASALAFAFALAWQAHAADIPATPANVWTQVHDVAQPGDRVLLGPGVYDLSMWNTVKAAPGIIVMPGPAGGVTANVIAVNGSQNVTYKGITVQMLPTTQYGVDAEGATTTNVVFDGLTIKGADCSTLGGVGAWFRGLGPASGVVLKNSKLSCLGAGVGVYSSDGLSIVGNDLQLIQTDGIIATGVTNLLIKGNAGGNFHTAGGGHPDFIQFANNSEQASAHIEISGNRFERGAGDLVQGVFGEDGTDVKIIGNVIIGPMYNGIEAARTKGLLIDHNYQQALAVGDDLGSWIGVRQEAADVTITCNSAAYYQIGVPNEPQPVIAVNSGNVTNKPAAPGDYSQLLAFQATPCAGSTPAPTPAPVPAPTPTPVPTVDPLQPALDAANAQIAADQVTISGLQAQITLLKAKIAKAQAALIAYPTNTAKALQTKIANALAALK